MRLRLSCRYAVLLSTLFCGACKKIIQVNLVNVSPQIVIEGNVTDDAGPYQVQISRSVDYAANNVFPPVTDAVVSITDSTTGQTDMLLEVDSGVYATQTLIGQPKHTYQLLVIEGGQRYSATSTMPISVKPDSVTFEQNTNFNGIAAITAIVYFQDPAGVANYYQFMEAVNGKAVPDIFVFDDRLSDGKYIEEPLFNDTAYLEPGSALLLTMNCVDENIYNYFYELSIVTATAGIESTTPANPTSNISNGALGYFSAHTTTAEQLYVY
jgi:Domain of unknown function (DUF4249)